MIATCLVAFYEETASMYTCNECGGKTWKPHSPLFLNLFCVVIFGSMLIPCLYVMEKEGSLEDPAAWFVLLIIAIFGLHYLPHLLDESESLEGVLGWAQSKGYPENDPRIRRYDQLL